MYTRMHQFCKVTALAAFLAVVPILPGNLRAQSPEGPDTSSSTTEDSTGKVTGITPNETITVDSRRGPFTYRLGRDLHVVSEEGKPIKVTAVKVGQRVTVYYYMRDGQETAARISVLKPAGKKSP